MLLMAMNGVVGAWMLQGGLVYQVGSEVSAWACRWHRVKCLALCTTTHLQAVDLGIELTNGLAVTKNGKITKAF